MESSGPTDSSARNADHLCVLVHGLYGNPSHLDYIASALQEKYGNDKLLILAVKRNTGSLTYDGIELGGERVAHEIEDAIDEYSNLGYIIRKLSIVGYSLGGLIGRYAVGLLYSKGYFDKIQPVNFTTFASPHVGVRSPARRSHFWNVLGARTISKSGRQLFMIDNFRDTGKPLLSILAARGSIFMLGLAKFKSRCIYANIINDRAAVFYTTGISKTDPFVPLDGNAMNYLPEYSPVLVDPHQPVHPQNDKIDTTFWKQAFGWIMRTLSRLPFLLFLFIFIPIASLIYLVNAAIQTARSRRRIRLHEEGKLGVPLSAYNVPLIVEEMRNVVEEMYETVNAAREPEYLSENDDNNLDELDKPYARSSGQDDEMTKSSESMIPSHLQRRSKKASTSPRAALIRRCSSHEEWQRHNFPTLALTPAQFTIIDNLNSVGFRKYPVHIHNVRHSHAAIIVRMPRKSFDEGKIVIRHWLDREFRI